MGTCFMKQKKKVSKNEADIHNNIQNTNESDTFF